MVFGREPLALLSLDPHSTTVKTAFLEPIAVETKRAFGSFGWFDRKAFTVYTAQNKAYGRNAPSPAWLKGDVWCVSGATVLGNFSGASYCVTSDPAEDWGGTQVGH